MHVLVIRALLIAVYVGVPDFWKLSFRLPVGPIQRAHGAQGALSVSNSVWGGQLGAWDSPQIPEGQQGGVVACF